MWNLKKLQLSEKKNLITIENDQIIETSIFINPRQIYNKSDYYCYFSTIKGNVFDFGVKKLKYLKEIFNSDNDRYTLDMLKDFNKKYIRLVIYHTPEEEMHQLSDPTEIIGVMHIVHNRLFLFDEEKIHVGESRVR